MESGESFSFAKYCGKSVSVSREPLGVTVDVWENGKFVFNPEICIEMHYFWKLLLAKPFGVPARSRKDVNFAVGADMTLPTTLSASFVCEEDQKEFEKQLFEILEKKEAFLDVVKWRKKQEDQEKKEKAQRAKALKK